jgi:hypothetical protein
MITSSMTVTNKLNAHRAKYGFVQYMPPTGRHPSMQGGVIVVALDMHAFVATWCVGSCWVQGCGTGAM